MPAGKEAACLGAGVLFCVVVGGCVGPGGSPVDSRRITPRARSAGSAAELRIPQASGEIPVVPLPIPPAQRPAPPAAPKGADPPGSGPELPPATDAPTTPAQPVLGLDNIRRLHRLAAERCDAMDSYIARLTRREQVRGENKPEEVMLFKFRKQPWSVYLKWLGPTATGREVIYVKGQYENKIQTLLAAGDMPLAPAGKRMSLAPDSVFVRGASRHPLTEAGLGASVERLGHVLVALDRGDQRRGTLSDLGSIVRPEFGRPIPAVEHIIPPGLDPNLPRGGRCLYGFDPDNNLPVLVAVRDERGQEVEYYFYDRLQFPVRLDDNDFSPEVLWSRH
jgi:hypothetical protein